MHWAKEKNNKPKDETLLLSLVSLGNERVDQAYNKCIQTRRPCECVPLTSEYAEYCVSNA